MLATLLRISITIVLRLQDFELSRFDLPRDWYHIFYYATCLQTMEPSSCGLKYKNSWAKAYFSPFNYFPWYYFNSGTKLTYTIIYIKVSQTYNWHLGSKNCLWFKVHLVLWYCLVLFLDFTWNGDPKAIDITDLNFPNNLTLEEERPQTLVERRRSCFPEEIPPLFQQFVWDHHQKINMKIFPRFHFIFFVNYSPSKREIDSSNVLCFLLLPKSIPCYHLLQNIFFKATVFVSLRPVNITTSQEHQVMLPSLQWG